MSDLLEARSYSRIVIDPKCKLLRKGLSSMVWIKGGVDGEGDYDDPPDAARYGINCPYIRHFHIEEY